MIQIYKDIRRERTKQEISATEYMLGSIYISKDLRGESDNPILYEMQYSALAMAAFEREFKRHLEEIIRSGVFQTTFDISYYPQVNPKDIEEMTSMLVDLLNRPFGAEWAIQYRPEIEELVTSLYTASAVAGISMTNIVEPSAFSFDLIDKQSLEQLNNIGVFWMSEGARKVIVTDAVTALAKEAIREGMGLDAAGELFRNELYGVVTGKSAVYYRTLASVVMNRTRNVARINQFYRLEVTHVELLGIPDARQCPRCGALDGSVWEVAQIKAVIDNMIMASSPEELIASTPFINSIDSATNEFVLNNGSRVSTTATTDVLAQTGITLPLHGGCRCQWIIYIV